MTFENFEQLFIAALETAADNAEQQLGRKIARNYEIELHLYGKHIVDVEEAAIYLFIDENTFNPVIDIAVIQVSPTVSRVFVRASGFDPVPFHRTFNFQHGTGPFKQLIALKIIETGS